MKLEEVKSAFDDADKYLRNNTSIPVRIKLISKMLNEIHFRDYIELGCGDGSIALSLLDEKRRAVLIDFSREMIERAKEKTPPELIKNVKYEVGNIFTYETEDKFDLLLCIGVLAHVPSIEKLFVKIDSLLSTKGYLVLQFTEARSLFGWIIYKFMRKSGSGYSVNKTSILILHKLLSFYNYELLEKQVYSDSGMGLGLYSLELAEKFKLWTSRINMPGIFSEVILLLRRVPNTPIL